MANWGKISSRGNVEDRRSFAPIAGGISLTGLALYLIFNLLTGGSASDVLDQLQNIPIESQQNLDRSQFKGEDSYEIFTSTVIGSNNDMWSQVFSSLNKNYEEPRLVLFRTATNSACGTATSQVGPHYCPLDKTIYLDETFFDELTNRFGAEGGDVAQAYVMAHEVGHHAQNLLGILDELRNIESADPEVARSASIQTELQADCFAGLWINSIKDLEVLEPNEVAEAMDAAAAVGDDRIQEKVAGRVDPETWTHGSSSSRISAFTTGYESGNLSACSIK